MGSIYFLDLNYTDFLIVVNGTQVQGSKGAATYKHTLRGDQTFKVTLLNGHKLVGQYYTLAYPQDRYYCNESRFTITQIDDKTFLLYTPCAERDAICGFKAYGPPITRYFPTPIEEKIIEEVKPPEVPAPIGPPAGIPPTEKPPNLAVEILSALGITAAFGVVVFLARR
jgi:hypothetical protein